MTFSSLLCLLFGAMLTENLALGAGYGFDAVLTGTQTPKTAAARGVLTALFCTAGSVLACGANALLSLAGLTFLRLPVFALLLGLLAVAVWAAASKKGAADPLYPLCAANGAVLAAMLYSAQGGLSLGAALLWGLGAGLGFLLVSLLFAGLRVRLAACELPRAFAGLPAQLLSAALLYLAFSGLLGLRF